MTPVKSLDPQDLCQRCDPDQFDFEDVKINRKQLKTIRKYTVYLHGVSFPRSLLEGTIRPLLGGCDCDPDLLVPNISGVWDWDLRYICKIAR